MNAQLEKFDSGWIGISFSLKPDEIDVLIEQLKRLKNTSIGHFHFRADDFTGDTGIADVEISLGAIGETDNLKIE